MTLKQRIDLENALLREIHSLLATENKKGTENAEVTELIASLIKTSNAFLDERVCD